MSDCEHPFEALRPSVPERADDVGIVRCTTCEAELSASYVWFSAQRESEQARTARLHAALEADEAALAQLYVPGR